MTFFTHRWVRGEAFWGRKKLIQELKGRLNKFTWILGNRRIGKTSLLRQIELLCKTENWGFTPLYLDFQGAGDDEGLKMAFLEAFDEQEEFADELKLDLDQLESRPLSSFLYHIKRQLKRSKISVLFLIDEAEELVDISHSNPQVLSLLRKFFHDHEKIGVFLTSSYVLHEVKEPSRTSQFIQEFLPPLRLFPFTEDETVGFLGQNGISPEDSAAIYETCYGNPYLVQNLGEKTQQLGFENACKELHNSKFFKYFFESNFNCLPLPLREGLQESDPAQFFQQLEPTPDTIEYLTQSTIFVKEDNAIKPNPLLYSVYSTNSLVPKKDQTSRYQLFYEFARALSQREKKLSALHLDADWPDPALVRHIQEPPSMEMLQLSDEKALLHTLLWASPEFIQGATATEQTHVYLAALFLSAIFMKKSPLHSFNSIRERSQAYLNTPVELNRTVLEEFDIQPKTAMILLKALSVDPKLRYHDVDSLVADVKQVETNT
ncbi:MAG: hypothetical protein CR997_00930 [Acidobacteria bacterium]|nr:MAG: hypothetical protein CR997_00930 [Acidobacteriota bacterium]